MIARVRGEKLSPVETRALAEAQARLGTPEVNPDLNAKTDAGGTFGQWRAPEDATARLKSGEVFQRGHAYQILPRLTAGP